jgi:hypothetical protein
MKILKIFLTHQGIKGKSNVFSGKRRSFILIIYIILKQDEFFPVQVAV